MVHFGLNATLVRQFFALNLKIFSVSTEASYSYLNMLLNLGKLQLV